MSWQQIWRKFVLRLVPWSNFTASSSCRFCCCYYNNRASKFLSFFVVPSEAGSAFQRSVFFFCGDEVCLCLFLIHFSIWICRKADQPWNDKAWANSALRGVPFVHKGCRNHCTCARALPICEVSENRRLSSLEYRSKSPEHTCCWMQGYGVSGSPCTI
jgi:hypothetical protein